MLGVYMIQTTVVTTRRVLERVAVSYVSQRMAWKILKGNTSSSITLLPNNNHYRIIIYNIKVSRTEQLARLTDHVD